MSRLVELHLSQLMLEMASFHADTLTETETPLFDSVVNDLLIRAFPFLHQSFVEMRYVLYLGAIHPVLKYTPYFVVDWVEISTVG